MLDISDWHVTSFHRLSELPFTSGVYIVVTDRTLYVGKSLNMKLRWKNHSHAMELALAGAQELRWKEFPKGVLASVEAEMIEQYKPLMNIRSEQGLAEKRVHEASTAAIDGDGYKVKAECWRCFQCGHVWLANVWKQRGEEPSHCARCKSRSWRSKQS
jgi:predicted Zn-ribbon and HTH transcriptional regulator